VTDNQTSAVIALKRAEKLRLINDTKSLNEAKKICISLISKNHDYFGALLTLGLVEMSLDNNQNALGLLVRAVMINPNNWRANVALGTVYLELGSYELADIFINTAYRSAPEEVAVLYSKGDLAMRRTSYREASHFFNASLENDPLLNDAVFSLAKLNVLRGDPDLSSALLEKLIGRDVDKFKLLSEIMTLPDSYLNNLLKKIDLNTLMNISAISTDDKVTLYFALGYQDHFNGHYEMAFENFCTANKILLSLKKKELIHLKARQKELFEHVKNSTNRIKGKKHKKNGHEKFLLILGPSRSGKTTLESMLRNDDHFTIGYENSAIENAVKRTLNDAGRLQSSLLEVLPQQLNSEFLENLDIEVNQMSKIGKILTNTNPSRIFDVNRLLSIRSNTFVVVFGRNILDNALKIFTKRYMVANSYAYCLDSTFEHLRWYDSMAELLLKKYPDRTIRINYEDLIENPSTELGRVYSLVGLDEVDNSSFTDERIGNDIGISKNYRAKLTEFLN